MTHTRMNSIYPYHNSLSLSISNNRPVNERLPPITNSIKMISISNSLPQPLADTTTLALLRPKGILKMQCDKIKRKFRCTSCDAVFRIIFLLLNVSWSLVECCYSIYEYSQYVAHDAYTIQGKLDSTFFYIVKNGYSSENCSYSQQPSLSLTFFQMLKTPASYFESETVYTVYRYYMSYSWENKLIHIGFWIFLLGSSGIAIYGACKDFSKCTDDKDEQENSKYTDDSAKKKNWKCCYYSSKLWKKFKTWLCLTMIPTPCFVISAFDYDAICLESDSYFVNITAAYLATFTFTLNISVMAVAFDIIYPKLFICGCRQPKATKLISVTCFRLWDGYTHGAILAVAAVAAVVRKWTLNKLERAIKFYDSFVEFLILRKCLMLQRSTPVF
ncbi:unnamed protein product [Rotaria magnacalcarata]